MRIYIDKTGFRFDVINVIGKDEQLKNNKENDGKPEYFTQPRAPNPSWSQTDPNGLPNETVAARGQARERAAEQGQQHFLAGGVGDG